MKKITPFYILSIFLFILLISTINAVSVGTELIENLNVSAAHPYVFKCGNTTYYDDPTEPGRVSPPGQPLIERKYPSLFEGEQIKWKILVMDLNGINNLAKDNYDGQMVYATVGENKQIGNTIEVMCKSSKENITEILDSCDLNGLESEISSFNSNIMAYYDCIFATETPESMYGKKWITVEAKDNDGSIGVMEEAEQWFLNPIIGLSVEGDLGFNDLIAGKTSYSDKIYIKSGSDNGSGVIMDMFISGTNFTSSDESSLCPKKQVLGLDRIKYFARNSIYDTSDLADSDFEGYRPFKYGIGFNNPNPFYDNYEIIPKNKDGFYYLANQINPEDKMELKLKANIPTVCKGDFSGAIYLWGEAI